MFKPLKQTRLHIPNKQKGNCLPTVIACLLGKNSAEDVLQIQELYDDEYWYGTWIEYLESEYVYIIDIHNHVYDNSLYMVSGKSQRGVNHICIYKNGELYHDPHPDNTGLLPNSEYSFEKLVSIFKN
jgi:hypothetical protein